VTRALVVFEDERWRELRPLTDLVPVPALAFGASSLAARIAHAAGLPLSGIEARAGAIAACRTLPATAPADAGAEVIAVNAAALPGPWLRALVSDSGPAKFRSAGRIAAARLTAEAARDAHGTADFGAALSAAPLKDHAVEPRWLDHPWQIIEWNAEAIAADLAHQVPALRGDVHKSAVLLDDSRITVEPGARVDPLAVLDARGGPILVRKGAIIGAHTVVVGPCVVGEGTQLLGGVVTRTSFGKECRVAGEVEECVWQGFANKRHHGFVGHSVIGEWVNLGALTTTSDLKNNYGEVRVVIDGRERATGSNKIGSFIGAHVKTGIGTLLPTGAAIGTGSNLFGGGRFAPKSLASFAWWDGQRTVEHHFEQFVATARTAMSRRNETLDDKAAQALRELFEATRRERSWAPEPQAAG